MTESVFVHKPSAAIQGPVRIAPGTLFLRAKSGEVERLYVVEGLRTPAGELPNFTGEDLLRCLDLGSMRPV